MSFDPVSMTGDIGFDGRNILLDTTPTSQILVALGTDRRAHPTDVLPDAYSSTNPQGPMAGRRGTAIDALDPLGRRIGCRWWLLAREKQTEDVRKRAEGYVGEALAGLDAVLGVDIVYQVLWVLPGWLAVLVQAGAQVTRFVMPPVTPTALPAKALF